MWGHDQNATQHMPVTNKPAEQTAYLPILPVGDEAADAPQGPRVVKTELYRRWAGLSNELRSLHGVSLLGIIFAFMMLFMAPGNLTSWRSLWILGGIAIFLIVAFLTRKTSSSTRALAVRRFVCSVLTTVGFVLVLIGVMTAVINVIQHIFK